MKPDRCILLSFDVEEFDLPLEYNQVIDDEQQMKIGFDGLQNIMPLLTRNDICTTLFTTAFFAERFPDTLKQLATQHEIGSHTYYHTKFEEKDLLNSKLKLQEITNKAITGLRMPRMKVVRSEAVIASGYAYNSSINPCWIPGRYDNRHISRTIYNDNGIAQVPTSVTPNLRIPLFWLAFKNMPYKTYLRLALKTLKNDGYLCLYFHPWEFTEIRHYNLPVYIRKADPVYLLSKLTRLVNELSNEARFITMQEFVAAHPVV